MLCKAGFQRGVLSIMRALWMVRAQQDVCLARRQRGGRAEEGSVCRREESLCERRTRGRWR